MNLNERHLSRGHLPVPVLSAAAPALTRFPQTCSALEIRALDPAAADHGCSKSLPGKRKETPDLLAEERLPQVIWAWAIGPSCQVLHLGRPGEEPPSLIGKGPCAPMPVLMGMAAHSSLLQDGECPWAWPRAALSHS